MNDLLIILAAVDETDEELATTIRRMKSARDKGYEHILCLVGGFDKDPRELQDIPEVRAFARRLIKVGFISLLDFSGTLFTKVKPGAWGAMEILLVADGRMKKTMSLNQSQLESLVDRWVATNATAQKAIDQGGPITGYEVIIKPEDQ